VGWSWLLLWDSPWAGQWSSRFKRLMRLCSRAWLASELYGHNRGTTNKTKRGPKLTPFFLTQHPEPLLSPHSTAGALPNGAEAPVARESASGTFPSAGAGPAPGGSPTAEEASRPPSMEEPAAAGEEEGVVRAECEGEWEGKGVEGGKEWEE
jgi:hypothetical protein